MERIDNTLADLLPDILCRLPVKSLMQFRCVEKPWCHLIDDPKFIIKHFLFFNNPAYINGNSCSSSYDLIVKSARQNKSFVSLFSDKQDQFSLDLLDLPYNKNVFAHLQVLGPCNGIYYLHGYPNALMNPSMREFKVLPDTHVPPPEGTEFTFNVPGFGFDPRTQDYRVVLLKLPSEHAPDSTWLAEVYSLNTNQWRQVESPIPSSVAIKESEMSTFVNGAYHWWGYDAEESSVIAFDMVNEEFRTIRFPLMSDSSWKTADVSVVSYKNSLAVILYPPNGRNKHFDMWVLQDYSDDSSWAKHSRIQPLTEAERPIGFLRSGHELILENRKGQAFVFDLNTKGTKELGIQGESKSLQPLVYEESLASLKRENQQRDTDTDVSVFNVVAGPLLVCSSG